MQYTTNYNLMKPEPSDMYSVEHQNQNSDILDEVLVPEFEDYEVTDDETETQSETTEIEIPDAATALASIKSKTKIAQLFSNIKAFCKGCCTLGMLVNNCVTDNASLPLAASQGKMLMDQINLLNSKQEARAMDKVHKSWDTITTRKNEEYIQLDISDLTAHISSFEFAVITYWGGCANADGHQPFSIAGSGTNFYFISRPNTTITNFNADFWYYIKNRK